MKHKRSLEALIVGFVLAIAVSFFSTKIAGAVLAVSLIQMFLFYLICYDYQLCIF